MDDDLQEQAQGVDQHMPLAPVDLLTAIVPMGAALLGRSHRLAVDDRCAWGRFPSSLGAYPLPQPGMDALPGAIQAPSAEVMRDGLITRELVRHESPGAATAHQIKDAIQDTAQVDRARTPAGFSGREPWGQQRPFLGGE